MSTPKRFLIHIRLLLLMTVLLPVFGCTPREVRRTLSESEEIMEADPDSAKRLLESIEVSRLRQSKDKALYGLLWYQVHEKVYAPLTQDSLLREALEYYEKSDDDLRLVKARVYEAMYLQRQGRYYEAVSLATAASEAAREMNQPLWEARAEEILMDVFHTLRNTDEALLSVSRARNAFKKAGYHNNARYIECFQGIILNEEGHYQQAESILDSIRILARDSLRDINLQVYADCALMAYYSRVRKCDEALKIYHEMLSLGYSTPDSIKTICFLADLAVKSGDIDKAETLYDIAWSRNIDNFDSLSVYLGRADIAMARRDYRDSKLYMDSVVRMMDKITRMITTESATRSQRDLYYDSVVLLKERGRLMERNLLLTILCSVILCVALGTYLFMKLKVKKFQRRALMDRIHLLDEEIAMSQNEISKSLEEKHELSEELTEVRASLSDMNMVVDEKNRAIKEKDLIIERAHEEAKNHEEVKNLLGNLYQQKLTALTKIWSDIVEAEDSNALKSAMISDLKKKLDKFRSSAEQKRMIADIDLYMDGLASSLRTECAFLSEDELYFIYLILSGVHPKLICFLCDIRLKTFYSRRARLKARIDASDARCKDKISIFL
ncbi:MAG: hypothetical protein K2O24_07105 [Muribaculaceae bacterium]|nr:hypothetical protein [Muribaculaceae bacterium]